MCRMHKELCVCSEMPRFNFETQIILVMHRREHKKVTATGPLALHCLSNSELLIHGNRDNKVDLNSLDFVNRRVLFLYPRAGAPNLSRDFHLKDNRPVTLIVPDGNWNQAARMSRRLNGIRKAEFVTLPDGAPTRWGLRKETREGGLSTFEAIARSIGIIESEAAEKQMLSFFDLMVGRVKKLRGNYN